MAGEPRTRVVAIGGDRAWGSQSAYVSAERVPLEAHSEVGCVAHLETVRGMVSSTARRKLVPEMGRVVLTSTRRSGVPDHRHGDPGLDQPGQEPGDRLERPPDDVLGVRGGMNKGHGHSSLDLCAELLAVQLVRRQPIDVCRRFAKQVTEAGSRHLERGCGDCARVREDRHWGSDREARLHPPELHHGEVRRVPVHRRGSRHAHELATHETRDVPGGVGDHAGPDCDDRVGSRVLQRLM